MEGDPYRDPYMIYSKIHTHYVLRLQERNNKFFFVKGNDSFAFECYLGSLMINSVRDQQS